MDLHLEENLLRHLMSMAERLMAVWSPLSDAERAAAIRDLVDLADTKHATQSSSQAPAAAAAAPAMAGVSAKSLFGAVPVPPTSSLAPSTLPRPALLSSASSAPPLSSSAAARAAGRHASARDEVMLYFNHFELSAVVVKLSVAASASSLSASRGRGHRAFGGGSGNSFDAYKRAIGLVVTNLEDARITLGGKRAENFGILSQSTLVSQLSEHYKAAALGEVYNILGSAKFLGNPVGLLNNLSTGLSEFYHAPGAGCVTLRCADMVL
jgi:hypothetical protein